LTIEIVFNKIVLYYVDY